MTFRIDHQAWQDKFNDLQTRIDDVIAIVTANSGMDREATLQELLTRLKAFHQGQFEFFFDGFAADTGGVLLEHSYKYPPEYIFRTLLDQVHTDLTIIRQAVNQRLNANEQPALETADKLAMAMLQPALTASFITEPDTTVLTYFRQAARARIIAYAPVVLIGIPFSAVGSNWIDFLSIAHEVGHYVYRYGSRAGSEVGRFRTWLSQYAEIKGLESWCSNWLEEIFADVYGTILGGPDFADSMQKLLEDNSLKQFLQDDQEHPLQPLRPQIHIETLNDLGATTEASNLSSQWTDHLDERRGGKPTSFTVGAAGEEIDTTTIENSQELARSWIMAALTPMLYDSVSNPNGVQTPQFWDIWDDLKNGTNPTITVPTLAAGQGETLWIDIVKAEHQAQKGNGTTPSFTMPPIAWMAFRSAGGWGDLPDNGDGVTKDVE